jgi:hypothetical protein
MIGAGLKKTFKPVSRTTMCHRILVKKKYPIMGYECVTRVMSAGLFTVITHYLPVPLAGTAGGQVAVTGAST